MVYANLYKRGQITLASIRGGMSMVSNSLTVLSFVVFLLSSIIDCNILPRLLGVLLCNKQKNNPLNPHGREGFVRLCLSFYIDLEAGVQFNGIVVWPILYRIPSDFRMITDEILNLSNTT